jgi:hypothetical protein
MHWWHLIAGLQVLLALIVTLRVFVLRIQSVRRMLFFLLLPTILTPISFLSPAGLVDYRKVWICFSALEWTWSVGVVHAFLSAALSNFDGLLKISRKAWTLALVLGIGTAVLLTRDLPNSLASLTMDVLALNRAIVTLVGFVLILLVGLVLYYSIPILGNVAKVSIGTAMIFGVRALRQFGEPWTHDVAFELWMRESGQCSGLVVSPTGVFSYPARVNSITGRVLLVFRMLSPKRVGKGGQYQ